MSHFRIQFNQFVKNTQKKTWENTPKLRKFACNTLHAHCYNLREFGLLWFLIAGWVSAVVLVRVALLAKIKLSRHIQMLVFYVIRAKSDPSFLTEWKLFLIIYMFFTWILICRLCRDYKKVSTKNSFGYQFATILIAQRLCNTTL